MLNISYTLITAITLTLAVTSYGQSTEAIDKLKAISDEILLIKVTNDSTVHLMENFRCYSAVYGDVIEIFKRTKIPSDRKKLIVFRGAKCDETGFPLEMKLLLGQQYFVFLSTEFMTEKEIKSDQANPVQFNVSDVYLGILLYNEDLHKYLKK